MPNKIMHWTPICSLLPAVLLFGCVATYEEPAGENRAELTFVNQTDLPLAVDMFGDASACKYRQKLGSMIPANGAMSIKISANAETAIGVVHGYTGADFDKYCRMLFSFQPDQTKKYQVIAAKNPEKCFIQVVEKQKNDDSPFLGKPTPISQRKWVTPLDEEGPWCEPKGA